MLDVGRWTLDVVGRDGRWMWEVGSRTSDVRRSDVGRWTLDVGRWDVDVQTLDV